MRQFIVGLATILATCGCSKTGKKFDSYQLSAHITGNVKSLDISYMDMEPAIPNGIFQINGPDGKTYHFKFAKVADIFANEDNCTMSLDTTLILEQDALMTDTTGAFLVFKPTHLPNTITIRFYDSADVGDTHGVKDVTAAFGPETIVAASFLNEWDNKAAYVSDRIKAINKINAIMYGIKDISPNPGDQPAKMLTQAYTY